MEDKLQLVGFYAGTRPDDRGRFLREMLRWPDYKLEETHDYPEAPILDANTIHEFRSRPELRRHVQASFRRMLAFYGMEIREAVVLTVTRAAFFAERSEKWITPSNHNHLRITRILKSLRLLGLESEATAFFDCLTDIYFVELAQFTPGIFDETFGFWRAAVGREKVI